MTARPRASRAMIADAGIALLRADPGEGLGFNRVARALGIQPPSLYNHVEDGEALRRVVATRAWQIFCDACERTQGRKRGARALKAFGASYRQFARDEPGLFDLMEVVALDPKAADFLPSMQRVFRLFAGPLEELGVPAAERTHLIRALRAAVHGFVVLERRGQFAMAEDVDESFTLMLNRLIARPSHGAPSDA
jgi:AcrR family transcriptional regulator